MSGVPGCRATAGGSTSELLVPRREVCGGWSRRSCAGGWRENLTCCRGMPSTSSGTGSSRWRGVGRASGDDGR